MKNIKKAKKKEFFTFMFLPGPFKRVRTMSISKSILKSIFLSFLAILVLSFYLIYEYNSMKDKIYEINQYKEELQGQPRRYEINDRQKELLKLRMEHKLSELLALQKESQIQRSLYESFRSITSILVGINYTPLLIFTGFLVLIAVIFFMITKVRRIRASSRSAVIKNKLVHEFCAALESSPLKPITLKRPKHD